MELYSMPQLDKSSSAYSDLQYVERSDISNRGLPVDVKKFSPVSGDILTSSAWSAVIHRPAEDSEPEDLPSTVDMDAIKGSPATPLSPTGPLGWSDNDQGRGGRQGGKDDAGDGSDSDDEDDDDDSSSEESSSPNSDDDGDEADSESGTARGSGSDSGSDSSSYNSYDSDSDSGSSGSSCSSRSGQSSHSSEDSQPKQFLVRETDKEQLCIGGLKMKISALRPTEKDKCDEKGDDKHNKSSAKIREEDAKEDTKENKRTSLRKEEERLNRRESSSSKAKEDDRSEEQKQKEKEPKTRGKDEERSKEKTREVNLRPGSLRASCKKGAEADIRRRAVKSKVGLSNNMVAGSRGAVRNDCSTASSQSEGISDEDHDSDKEETSRDEISQLAERLEHSPDLAEHLQVINEEDLAAILPDVESAVPVDDAPFDPFEDVSSESAKNGSTAERKSGVSSTCVSSRSANVASNSNTTESGSDVELPAQVVSDAIERIQIDTEGKSTSVGHTENANDDRDDDEEEDTHEGDSSDGGNSRNVYSSSLLQQFVESTERLSGKRASTVPGHWGSKRTSVGGNTHLNKRNARQKRSRLPKSESSRHNVKGSGGLVTVGAGSTDSCAVVVAKSAPPGPAELEVYCSVSNVSPDSGIYCVAGSPWHQSSPAHSPQHTLQQKTLPSPPHLSNALDQHSGKKGLPKAHTSRSKNVRKANRSCTLELQRDLRVPPIHPANESEDEVPPPSPLLSAPARRGPGRPKKAPPILEPCLPLQTKSIQRASHSGDHNRTKGTKGRKKESVSSDRSLERCDKLWKYLPSGKSRSRGVKVTSQGVQCNQSEFSQPSPRKQKKKKRNSMSQSRQGRQGKSVDNLQGSVFREDVKLHQTICDRLNKRLEVPEGVGGPLSDATTPSNSVTKRTPSKSVSTLQRHHSTSVSKQKLGTSVEKRKKGRRREQAAQLAAAAAALVANSAALVTKSTTPSSTSSAVGMGLATTTTTTSSQRSSKLPNMSQQRHSGDKVVCTPCGLKPSHHKHKKHRRRKERRPRQHHSNSAQIDPVFLSELERLIVEFQRSCCITRLPHLAGRCGENVKHHLPSIFRVKRIAKKRKGSERSQNSDKESGPETETVPLAGTPAPRDTRDKGSTGGKRRPKKASVETPKGRERLEANNEQRLPLKKRHYHMSATSSNQQSPLTSSPEISPDFTSSLEEKQSDRGSPATSISSKSSIASASTQSVPGSKTSVALTAVSTVNSSSSCKPYVTTTAGKTGMVASVSSLGKAIAASFTSDPNTKDISNTVCNTGSKVITPVCSVPNKVSVLTSTGTVTLKSSVLDTTGKVSVVSPVANVTNRGGIPSISCVTTVASLATVPGIISKANTAASFASICSTTVISETASSSCKETVVSVSNVTDMFPSSTANKNILPPATAVNQVNKPVVTSFSSLAPPKMSPVTTVSSLNSQSKLLPAVSSPSTKPTSADCLAVSAIKATMVTSVIAKTSVITSSTSVASKTSLTNSSPVVSKPGPQPSVITTTNKSSSSSSVNVSGTSNNSKSSGTSSPPKVSLVQKAKSGETNRNSIDEAIEACITRYSCGSQPALPSPLTRSVITTPKKRHRMEMQGKSGMGTGKGKESEVTSVSSTSTHVGKRSNSRTAGASVPLVECQPPEQVTSSGGSKLPESGIFEPSLSSEDFVDLPLPATPIKSVIAVLSKLKSATPPTTPPATEEVVLTSHNLRQKKTNHVLECKVLVCGSKEEADPKIRVVQELKTMVTRQEGMAQASSPALASVPELASASTISVVSESAVVESEVKPVILKDQALPSLIEQLPVPKPVSTMDCPPATGQAPTLVRAQTVEPSSEIKVGIKPNTRPTVQHQQNKMKDVRIHVRKLSSSDLLLQKAIGAANKQRTRRRKCNRTGFPVKRKKKKKACGETCEKAVVISPISTSLITSTSVASVPPEPSEVRTSSRVQNRKDQQTKEKTDPCISKVNPVEEELCDTSKVKMEHRESVAATDMEPSQQSVIVKYEDCSSISSNIKEELQLLDSFDEKSSARSLRAQREEKLHCVARSDDSTMADDEDAGFGMLLKREVTDVADLTRRNAKPKTKLVRTKAGKAVLRAMRAKFAEENTGILSLPSAISKNRRVARCRSQSWSSDSDDYALPSRSARGPEKLLKTVEIEDGAKHDHAKKSTKREMKRHATSLNDGPVKTKCAKSIKDDDSESLASKLKVRVDTEGRFNSMDSRSRGKRKCDGVEDGPSAAELRLARSKKRLRTVQRLEADSVDTDCDESLMEVQLSSALALGDAASEDETPKIGSKDAKQPRWRKKYLPAGLFSEYFKLDEPRPIVDNKKGLLQYKAEDHPHGLLPPPYHCGKWLRQRKINFQLPYDLWWLHTHNRLPGRDLVPSWNYKKIRTNVYTNVKPAYMHEPQACNCRTPETGTDKGCGDDCINRLVYTECVPGLCPLRDLCSNQRIQRHEWAPGLDKFMTKDKGWGVRTKLAIKNGEFILEYVGEVVSDREFKERMATRYTRDTHHYCLHLEGGLVIDGHRMGGDGRFVNHSCEPNCEMQKWCVNGLFRMALFALRDIEPNEELAYDYNFSLFNPAEGQPCKCGSNKCRGVIGGKSQRVNGTPAAQNGSSKAGPSKVSVEDIPERKGSRKNKRKTCRRNDGERVTENMRQRKRIEAQRMSQLLALNIRHMSHQQRSFVQQHHCFLLRNLEKVRRLKERLKQATQRPDGFTRPPPTNVKQSDVFLTQLNALSTPRNVRTRRLAQAEDNPELTRNARLACVLRDLYSAIVAAKDEKGEVLSSPFMTLPNKRKLPLYYERIREPIDFSTVEQNINSGLYRTLEAFDQDVCRILTNNSRFYGRTSQAGIFAVQLRKVYTDAKKEALPQLMDVLGETLPPAFLAEKDPTEDEDVIRCLCGLFRDEGMMIQCERCLVWQHCDCVQADSSIEHYLCEVCQPRPVDLEIKMDPPPSYATEGQINYVTLLRSNLQIRQGDTVYVLRDVTEDGPSQAKVTYKTIKDPKYADMDIFRIERLWKDDKGDRFAFGHHYLRPHETYHEPTRKFYPNEVMRVPLYEIISIDLIWARCWVLDPNTYCKGRPLEAVEEHVYICEYRVDKTAHLFSKISKSCRSTICTKSYAFETFETRLKPVRTYTPHGSVAPLRPKNRGNASSHGDDSSSTKSMPQQPTGGGRVAAGGDEDEDEEVPLARVRASAIAQKAEKRARQQSRLNGILLGMLARLPTKQPLDLSYLLEPNRRPRKKPASLNT